VAERLTRQQRQQQTRDRLLDAAQRLVAQRGLSTSLDEVASAAGLTKGAVYSNFASKEELLLALIERRADQPSEVAEVVTDQSVTVDERFATLARGYSTAMEAPRNRDFLLLTMELWIAAMRNPRLQAQYANAIRTNRRALADLIEQQTGGTDSERDALDLATLVIGLDMGIAIQHLLDPDAVPGKLYGAALQLVLQPALDSAG
jgi:AcrR family transcriptional regulator